MSSSTETLVKLLSSTKLNDRTIEITRTLLGSYCWGQKGKIYIPGFPSVLKKNYLHHRVGTLRDDPATEELGHANEFMHHVYFEPVQEVLTFAGRSLSDYQILTDRHNIRKIDSILQKDKGEPSQEDFMMFLQKRDKLLVVKREGNPLSTIVGHEFEKALCEPYSFESCHIIVECLVVLPDMPPIKMLIRGEVDSRSPTDAIYTPKDYKNKTKTATSSGLKVYTNPDLAPVSFGTLREIKMARELRESHHFQSWILGVPAVVHGAGKRSETRTKEYDDFGERFAAVVQKLLSCGALMEDSKVYP